jgi:DNA-binding XRE family transcriptional regulator
MNRPYSGFTGIGEKHKNVVRKGIDNHNAKLNPDKVREIRAKLANGAKRAELAGEFQVSKATIADIDRRITWRDVE